MRQSDLLFYGKDLAGVLRANLDAIRKDVDEIPESQLTASTDEQIIEYVFSKREVTPLELHEDQKEMETQETKIDARYDSFRAVHDRSGPVLIPATRIVVNIPFSGDSTLWACQPSTFTYNPPRGKVNTSSSKIDGTLEIFAERSVDRVGDGADMKRELDDTLSNIRSYLGWSRVNVDAHNRELLSNIRQCVVNRRVRLGTHAQLAKVMNIPLRKKADAPDLVARPLKRKLVKPLPTKVPDPADPGLRDEDFEHILNVIRHEARSFETTPRTFAVHDEEELRDIIIAHLNGHYEGDASGETFRHSGKTDIRIEFDNRAAFVAECKIWRGQKQFNDALDQLLGYLTWRDGKAAMIFFNKDVAGFSGIQASVPGLLEKHSCFMSNVSIDQAGEWRVNVCSLDDGDRKILLHVFLINLYVRKQS